MNLPRLLPLFAALAAALPAAVATALATAACAQAQSQPTAPGMTAPAERLPTDVRRTTPASSCASATANGCARPGSMAPSS